MLKYNEAIMLKIIYCILKLLILLFIFLLLNIYFN